MLALLRTADIDKFGTPDTGLAMMGIHIEEGFGEFVCVRLVPG